MSTRRRNGIAVERASKRSRSVAQSTHPAEDESDDENTTTTQQASGTTTSIDRNFRNLSTCNRCRIRKNRCDQRLPTCANCERVGASCTGFDPVTRKEIPRSYIYYLEGRVATLEAILDEQRIPYPQANAPNLLPATLRSRVTLDGSDFALHHTEDEAHERVDTLLGSSGMLVASKSPESRQPGIGSGISFARLVVSSVKSSVAASSDTSRTAVIDGRFQAASAGVKPVPLPSRSLGLRLIGLYIHNSNSMYPILDRHELEELFEKAYASQTLEPRELYILGMVFAIGAGIYLTVDSDDPTNELGEEESNEAKKYQPEDYHSNAMIHLEAFLTGNTQRRNEAALDELQAVLLLAAYALLRPAAPGLWYIVGIAVRRALDLGLHNEEALPIVSDDHEAQQSEGTKDLKRRLWWCSYSFDRLISTCVAKPCSVPDDVITSDFPSLSDNGGTQSTGFDGASPHSCSYKNVAHHYFRLRILQSEILQVMQSVQAQQNRDQSANEYYYADIHSPFLLRFDNHRCWRGDIDRRLRDWMDSAPLEAVAGASFAPEYFELNYWQTIVILYRQTIFVTSAGSTTVGDNAQNDKSDESDDLYLMLSEASRNVLRLYRELHLMYLVNYTFLDTHQIFSAANAYLFAIWSSAAVRKRTTVGEIDLHILMATSVLNDLVDKCPHAAACRDALRRVSKATIRKCRLCTSQSTSRLSSSQRLASNSVDTGAYPGAAQAVNASTSYEKSNTLHPRTSSRDLASRTELQRTSNDPRINNSRRQFPTAHDFHEKRTAAPRTGTIMLQSSGYGTQPGVGIEHPPADLPPLIDFGYPSGTAVDPQMSTKQYTSGSAGIVQSPDQTWNFDLNFGLDAHMEMFDGFFFGDLSGTGNSVEDS